MVQFKNQTIAILTWMVIAQSALAAKNSHYAPEPMHYYTPEVMALEGKLVFETFPGPPEYSSIKNGDKPERYWLLKLDHPISISSKNGNDSEGLYPLERNVRILQLTMDFDRVTPRKLGFEKDRKFKITGTLFHRITIHHVSRVLIDVQEARKLR